MFLQEMVPLQYLEGGFFLTNEHTSVNTPVNTIKSIIEGNLSKGDSDSALNSVHETWD